MKTMISFPRIGGSICPECCKYIPQTANKCNYCHEKQVSRRNYEARKRAEKREQQRTYEEVEKTFFGHRNR